MLDPEKRIKIDQIKEHEFFSKYNSNLKPNVGIIIGKDNIPIDDTIVEEIELSIGFPKNKVIKSIEANNHNLFTTTYYLRLKSLMIKGNMSKADINSDTFDEAL